MTWNDVLKYVILGLIAILGSPFTQWLKNQLNLEDRWALVLTGVVAAAFAVGEMALSGAVNWAEFSLQKFPTFFAAIFTLATVYFQWLKDSPSFFGRGFLLKRKS
jgi:hypothetical protein